MINTPTAILVAKEFRGTNNKIAIYQYPKNYSQATFGDRSGSNACTLIAVRVGYHALVNSLNVNPQDDSILASWLGYIVNSICDGNTLHDNMFNGQPVNLDVDDIIGQVADELNIPFAEDQISCMVAHCYQPEEIIFYLISTFYHFFIYFKK